LATPLPCFARYVRVETKEFSSSLFKIAGSSPPLAFSRKPAPIGAGGTKIPLDSKTALSSFKILNFFPGLSTWEVPLPVEVSRVASPVPWPVPGKRDFFSSALLHRVLFSAFFIFFQFLCQLADSVLHNSRPGDESFQSDCKNPLFPLSPSSPSDFFFDIFSTPQHFPSGYLENWTTNSDAGVIGLPGS